LTKICGSILSVVLIGYQSSTHEHLHTILRAYRTQTLVVAANIFNKSRGEIFLGEFEKVRKVAISFVVSVCSSVRLSTWNSSAPTGWIVITLDMWESFKNMSRKFKFYSNVKKGQRLLYLNIYVHNMAITMYITW